MNGKFSGNPAANCGLRIFALKKMLDFLSTQIADHEHVFEGTIIDKRNIVKCLLEKIKSLNDSIVPDGLIKHLATASNKSHKKALMDDTIEELGCCNREWILPTKDLERLFRSCGWMGLLLRRTARTEHK